MLYEVITTTYRCKNDSDKSQKSPNLTGTTLANGDILVIDGSRFYEVRGSTPGRTAWFDPRTSGYTLYAGTYGDAAKAAAEAAVAAWRRITSYNVCYTKLLRLHRYHHQD